MAENALFVWRYDYELKEGAIWTAHIAGYTEDQTRDYLHKIVGKSIRITAISQVCRLDAITDEFRKVIIDAATPAKRKPGRPPKKPTVEIKPTVEKKETGKK